MDDHGRDDAAPVTGWPPPGDRRAPPRFGARARPPGRDVRRVRRRGLHRAAPVRRVADVVDVRRYVTPAGRPFDARAVGVAARQQAVRGGGGWTDPDDLAVAFDWTDYDM